MKLPTSVLPPALVELTFLRAAVCVNAARLRTLSAANFRRGLHAEAQHTAPPPPLFRHGHGQPRYTISPLHVFLSWQEVTRSDHVVFYREQNNMIPPINISQTATLSELERRVQALEDAAAKEVMNVISV